MIQNLLNCTTKMFLKIQILIGKLFICYYATLYSHKSVKSYCIQYNLLNKVLYLNKMLFRFEKIDSPLCTLCKMIDETPCHLYHNCTKTKLLWDPLKEFISNEISFPSLMPQSAILGHIDLSDDYLVINHLTLT